MPKPEKRPFLIKGYNVLAPVLGLNSDLRFDKMIRKSKRNTGLSDFGSDFNDTALEVLLKSINQEAQLNPFGKLMIREKLIGQLENRLWAEHWFKKYPEILEQEVLPIVLITGLQRTGTTKMQRLLSGIPGARALMSWEALYPAPVKTWEETKIRVGRTRRNEKAVKWISPTFHSIHPIHTDQPEEDVLLLDVHFMSSSSEAIMQVPSYAAWLDQQDHSEAYRYEKKLLKLLQWQRGGKFWVLKSPHHMEYLDIVAREFPDTHVVWMHRQVEACIPSYLSMLFYSRSMFSDYVNMEALKKHWIHKLAIMVEKGMDFRESSSEKIIDVSFQQFMKSENDVVSRIFDQLKFAQELDQPKPTHPLNNSYRSNHTYNLKDWGLNSVDLNSQFSEYITFISNLKQH